MNMNYKKKVIEAIQKIESEKFMKFLYNMIISFKEQWGY
nr:MAG TPA: hypothetical protein [Bacteriophage sp.]